MNLKNIAAFLLVIHALLINPDSLHAMGKQPPSPPSQSTEIPGQKPQITLEECFRFALKQSEEIAIKRESISQTKANFLEATGEAIGDFNFVITNFEQEKQIGRSSSGGVESTSTAAERREKKFTYSQPLFQGFKSVGAIMGSGSLKGQRKEEKNRAVQLLYLDVAHAFYNLLANHRDVVIIRSILGLFEERISELNERERIGRSRPSEAATARSRMKILEAELARSEGDLKISQHILEFFTGIEIGAYELREIPQTEDFPSLDELVEAVNERPDVKSYEEAMKTAKQAIVVAQSGLWPHISLDMNQYEQREGFQSGIDWDLLMTINVPLFQGGTTFGEIKDSMSEYKKAKLTYEKVQREAELNIKEAFQNWQTSLSQSKSLEEAVKAAEENYQLQKDDYERNLVGNLDVLEALEVLLNTRREANDNFYLMKENYWKLQIASGLNPELYPDLETEEKTNPVQS